MEHIFTADLLEHHRALSVRHHVKMLNADRTLTARLMEQKLIAFATMDGPTIQVIFRPGAKILMNAIKFTAHRDGVA